MKPININCGNNKVILRAFSNSDLNDLVKNANNPNISKYLTNKFPYPYLTEHGLNFIKYANNQSLKHKIFAIEINGEVGGGIGLHPQDDVFMYNAELGYWLGQKYWGQGIVTSAVKEVVKFGFAEMDINRIFARPFSNNPASRRVLEKVGFTYQVTLKQTIFKNEEFLDEHIYCMYNSKLLT